MEDYTITITDTGRHHIRLSGIRSLRHAVRLAAEIERLGDGCSATVSCGDLTFPATLPAKEENP